jgi:hypothetical protein
MMKLKACWAVALISVSPCFTTGAKAMTIHDFGRMNADDEAGFVTLLVESSRDFLKAHGHPDQGAKVISLFKTAGKEGGVYKFADKLKEVDALNKKNAINPNNRATVLQIEDAMELTLKDEGYKVPATYLLTMSKSFQPSGIPRPRMMGP